MHKQLWIGLLLGAFVYGASCASLQSEPVAGNAQKAARICPSLIVRLFPT
jgi:hypothetical protein